MLLLIPFILILLGLALRMGLGLWYGARGPGDDDGVYLLFRAVSWFCLGSGMAIILLLPLVGSLATIVIGLMLAVVFAAALVDAVHSSRSMYRRINCKLLAIAAKEGATAQATELLGQVNSGAFVGEPAAQLAY
ncbi:MAG: hypothetical protein ACR2NU_01440, partial [Aeoliella sp.]